MINLFFNYYISYDKDRSSEIDTCFDMNLADDNIDQVFVLISEKDFKFFDKKNDKIKKIVTIEDRPSYRRTLDLIQEVTGDEDINLIINSDCYFQKDTTKLLNQLVSEEMWIFNRYDIIDNQGTLKFQEEPCTQDGWAIKGKPKDIKNINFPFGVPGCDNRFAYESVKSGYLLRNPSIDIKLLHLHLTNLRTCPYEEWEKHRLVGPYLFMEPTKL